MNDNDSFENNQKIETLQNENKTIKRLLNQTKNSLERHQSNNIKKSNKNKIYKLYKIYK